MKMADVEETENQLIIRKRSDVFIRDYRMAILTVIGVVIAILLTLKYSGEKIDLPPEVIIMVVIFIGFPLLLSYDYFFTANASDIFIFDKEKQLFFKNGKYIARLSYITDVKVEYRIENAATQFQLTVFLQYLEDNAIGIIQTSPFINQTDLLKAPLLPWETFNFRNGDSPLRMRLTQWREYQGERPNPKDEYFEFFALQDTITDFLERAKRDSIQ